MRLRTVLACVSVFSLLPMALLAGDWPMRRHDAARSGTSPDTLPEVCYRQWVRALPARRMAWQNEVRLQFDPAYHPVVLEQRRSTCAEIRGSEISLEKRAGWS